MMIHSPVGRVLPLLVCFEVEPQAIVHAGLSLDDESARFVRIRSIFMCE
jgi:hypothetical protein